MNEAEKQKLISELADFHKELKSYKRLLESNKQPSEAQKRYKESLREKLVHNVGRLKETIIQLTGKRFYVQAGIRSDIWDKGLSSTGYFVLTPLQRCIDDTNEAIGKLESISLAELALRGKGVTQPPKAFISHGKKSAALNKLEEFLRTLGVELLIVKEQPSLDKTVNDKVNYYLSQADFVVILATGDDKIEGKLHPRQNVIHEIGLAQEKFPGKIIYLLEEGAEFPSNIRPKVWESFKQRNMMNAFLCIVKELRAYGMLRVTKQVQE